jgi:hypothetical protein
VSNNTKETKIVASEIGTIIQSLITQIISVQESTWLDESFQFLLVDLSVDRHLQAQVIIHHSEVEGQLILKN